MLSLYGRIEEHSQGIGLQAALKSLSHLPTLIEYVLFLKVNILSTGVIQRNSFFLNVQFIAGQ